tara:strand:- start:600 stop:872 length:273 start_codon:yes stop_codon:yes gene_type:complete
MTTKKELEIKLRDHQKECAEKRAALLKEMAELERAASIERLTKKKLSTGLGDTIKKVTNALGVKQCGGCKKRQEKLNRLFPYKEEPKKDK